MKMGYLMNRNTFKGICENYIIMGRKKLNVGLCIVDECVNRSSVSKLCHKHYTRLKRYGVINLTSWYKNLGCKVVECDNKHDGLGYCKKHYSKYISNPKHSKNRILFKKKSILLKENPRKNICSNCEKIGYTHLHHKKYDNLDPLKYIVELCPSCHTKESWRLNQIVRL
jgi:hypothetical protein